MSGYLIIFICACCFLILSGICLWAFLSSDKHTHEGAEQQGVKPSAMLYHFKVKIFWYSSLVAISLMILIILVAGSQLL